MEVFSVNTVNDISPCARPWPSSSLHATRPAGRQEAPIFGYGSHVSKFVASLFRPGHLVGLHLGINAWQTSAESSHKVSSTRRSANFGSLKSWAPSFDKVLWMCEGEWVRLRRCQSISCQMQHATATVSSCFISKWDALSFLACNLANPLAKCLTKCHWLCCYSPSALNVLPS